MFKFISKLIVLSIMLFVVVGCSKTTVPTRPSDTPKYKIYFGQDAVDHGFVAPSNIQANKYVKTVYDTHKDLFATKTQKKEFDYDFNCNDIFDLLGTFGVDVPNNIRDLQCEGIIHAQRKGTGFLDWDVVVAVASGYGLGYQGYVGGVGGLNIAGSIMRSMDDIQIEMRFAVDYFTDSIAYVGSAQWGGSVAVGYGGVVFFDFPPTDHHVDMTVIDRFFGSDPAFSWDWNKDISFVIPAQN